jgi:hypothetical protein
MKGYTLCSAAVPHISDGNKAEPTQAEILAGPLHLGKTLDQPGRDLPHVYLDFSPNTSILYAWH